MSEEGSDPVRVRPPTRVPSPPDVAALDPAVAIWAAGAPISRCYHVGWGSRDFHAGDAAHLGRFLPFTPVGVTGPLPVLYGANDEIGALAETVFHDLPVRGVRRVMMSRLRHRLMLDLAPVRDLNLVDLTGAALGRLGISRAELIASDVRSYRDTARWAHALHAHPAGFDGLLWVSRQHETSRCLLLFGDRVPTDDLLVHDSAIPKPLAFGPGLELVCELADRAGITIIGLAP